MFSVRYGEFMDGCVTCVVRYALRPSSLLLLLRTGMVHCTSAETHILRDGELLVSRRTQFEGMMFSIFKSKDFLEFQLLRKIIAGYSRFQEALG